MENAAVIRAVDRGNIKAVKKYLNTGIDLRDPEYAVYRDEALRSARVNVKCLRPNAKEVLALLEAYLNNK